MVYIPIVHIRTPQPASDLQIVHMGLYQSVQDHSNDVTLVAHKPALLRVYAQSTHSAGPVPLAVVTVTARRNGQSIGSLASSPQPVAATPSADDLDSTFNFDLPLDWLDGEIVLTATVDAAGEIAESNEANNSRQSTFAFLAVPPLNLTIVPIHYVDTVTGITFFEPGHDPISEWLLAAFPISEIDVTIHVPVTFTGDLRRGEEWSRLLEELTALWALEAGPGSSHVYYGLIPNTEPGGRSWFAGGVSGLGWIGQRVSLGLDVGEETGHSAGHEIGHNLGRRHAPCGNPGGVDPHFPYPNASIGVYGVDVTDETLLDPNLTRDMMSYCGPEWVSDYTYEGLLQDQVTRSNRTGSRGDGLLLRASLGEAGARLLPAYRLNQPFLPAERSGSYRVELLDDGGRLIATYPADLYEAAERGVSAKMLMAHVPLTGEMRVATVRFLDGETVLAEHGMADILDVSEE